MKLYFILLLVVCFAVSAQVPRYRNMGKIQVDGKPLLLLRRGYGSPLVYDWDSDGVNDLLVGRFFGGNIMFLKNTGTNARPVLTDKGLLQAGGKTLSVVNY